MKMIHGIRAVREHLAKLPAPESLTVAERRQQYDRAEKVFQLPPEMKAESVLASGRPAEWLRAPTSRTDAALLYLHGGGYVIGSPRSHRHLAGAIAAAAGVTCLFPDYRLAPEHPFPAAVEDAVASYRWLLERGIQPARVALSGDSAGGGLVVATLLALRERALPLPAAGICISPWVDLTCSGTSYETKAARDPIVKLQGVRQMAQHYLGGADAKTPLASPLFADLSGLPPLLIHVGSDEVLLDDAAQLAARTRAAGGKVELEVWPDMIHVWHWFLPWLDEAKAAVDGIGRFMRAHLD
ncbi:MAG: alpha/beta hydrolase [Candidatus Rokuibacteriota bacterium]